MCSVIPSLVEVEEEEDFIPEAGELMGRGEGCGGGEKGGAGAKVGDDSVRPLVAGEESRRGIKGVKQGHVQRLD